MGNIKDFQELWESQPKYSFIKILIYFFTILIIAFLLIVVIKINNGDHVKIMGFEINDNIKNSNASKKDSTQQKQLEVKISDSSNNIKVPVKKGRLFIGLKKSAQPVTKKSIDTLVKPSTSFEFKAPIYGPSQFGNNNTQYNQGKIDRRPDNESVAIITKMLPIKSKGVTIAYESPDSESKNYSVELEDKLKRLGYKTVVLFGHLEIGTPQQPYPISIDTLNYRISIELNGH